MLIPNIIIIHTIRYNLNHTKTLAMVLGMLVIAAGIIVIVPEYLLQEANAAKKTYGQSTSMSTSCNGDTDEPCQTIECKNDEPCQTVDSNSDKTDSITACKDNKPCHNLDSNSSHPRQTENKTPTAAQEQQPDSGSNSDDDTTPFPQAPPIPRIQDYMTDEFDY